jgi:hypothetical protein
MAQVIEVVFIQNPTEEEQKAGKSAVVVIASSPIAARDTATAIAIVASDPKNAAFVNAISPMLLEIKTWSF